MGTTWVDDEVQALRREVRELRRDLEKAKSDLLWAECRRRTDRYIALQAAIIFFTFLIGGLIFIAVGLIER